MTTIKELENRIGRANALLKKDLPPKDRLCRADGADIGAAMVSAGMAWAFVRYSRDYVVQEQTATAQGVGVHAHQCEKAWEYRARARLDK
jgi:endonuclease YncB( thermonuclease family)